MRADAKTVRFLALLAGLTAALSACSQNEIILPGERFAIVDTSTADKLSVNPEAAAEGALLPPVSTNPRFDTPGLDDGHGGGHLSVEFPLERAFSVRVGIAANEGTEMAQPVVNETAVFTITPGGEVVATATADGQRIWAVDIDPSTDKTQTSISGGMSLEDQDLIVHAGKNRLVSLNAETGAENWSLELAQYIVGGPTVAGGFVLITDINGRVYAITAATGEELWNRIGSQGQTRITGAAFPAIANDETIIAGGDGELISLSLDQGGFNWGDNLVPARLITALDTIADITAHPIHDGGLVVAVTQSGVMVAYNARTGRTIWEQNLRSINMPWLAGETIFVTTTNNQVYAMRRNDGAIRWKVDLPGMFDMNDPVAEDAIRHTGPVVVSGKVLVAGQEGSFHLINAETGALETSFSSGGAITTALTVAGNTVYTLDRSGRLSAWR